MKVAELGSSVQSAANDVLNYLSIPDKQQNEIAN